MVLPTSPTNPETTGSSGPVAGRPRSGHQQLSPVGGAAAWRRLRGARQLLADRAARRRRGRQRPAERAGDGAHGRGAQGLRPDHGAPRGDANALRRDRGLPARASTASSSWTGSGGSPASSSRSCRTSRRRELALLGCLPLIDPDAEQVLLVDIGGGSTEVLWLDRSPADAGSPRRAVASVPIGVVVAVGGVHARSPIPPTFEAMVRHVTDLLAPIEAGARHRERDPRRARRRCSAPPARSPRWRRCSSACRATIAARIDGLRLDPDAMVAVSRRLRAMDNAEPRRASLHRPGSRRSRGRRLRDPGGGPAHAGRPASLRVADRGLREGMLHGLMGRTLDARAGTRAGNPGRPAGACARSPARRHGGLMPGRGVGPGRNGGKERVRSAKGRPHRFDPLARASPRRSATCSARARRAIARARPTSCSRSTRSTACSSPAAACSTWAAPPAAGCRWRRGAARAWSGVDLDEVAPVGGAAVLQGDIFDERRSPSGCVAALGGRADVLLSDVAAASTGQRSVDRLRAEAIGEAVLALLPRAAGAGRQPGAQAAARRRQRAYRRGAPAVPPGPPDQAAGDAPRILGDLPARHRLPPGRGAHAGRRRAGRRRLNCPPLRSLDCRRHRSGRLTPPRTRRDL